MTEGFYDLKEGRGAKIACVLPVFVPRGQIKSYTAWDENKLDTAKFTIAAHKYFKSGVAYDLIIVDNESPDPEARDFFKSLGAYRRINFGYSFGAWKWAWQHFGNKYDFYLFTEDDIAPTRNSWLAEILTKYLSKPHIGAIGSFVEGRSRNESMSELIWTLLGHDRDMIYNLDGSFVFTSSSVLSQIEIPLFDCSPGKFSPSVNEVVFVHPILKLGYSIESYDDGIHLVIHGTEVFTGDIGRKWSRLAPLININARRIIPAINKVYEKLA